MGADKQTEETSIHGEISLYLMSGTERSDALSEPNLQLGGRNGLFQRLTGTSMLCV